MRKMTVPPVALASVLLAGISYAQSIPASQPSKPLLSTTRLAPDEYGLQDYTVTTIGAASFTPISDDSNVNTLYSGTDFFRWGETANAHFIATVSIPSGAVIDFIGLESWSPDGPDEAEVQLYLCDRYANVTPIAGFQSTQHAADSDYNSTAIGFQLTRNVHNQLVVDVETLGNFGEFGWVEIWWKRSVSPPPAKADFNDVPTTHPLFQYIEALKESGITGGCQASPPLFCPDNTLTRGQMAVFLAKALGLHWPY